MKAIILIVCLFQSYVSQKKVSEMFKIEFIGKYVTGRAPCEWLPDGSRRWAKTTGFEIIKLIKGNLKVTYVEISYYTNESNNMPFENGGEYFVIIELGEERFKELELDKANTIMTYRNPIAKNEIIIIEKKPE